jgi:hypothetical protein
VRPWPLRLWLRQPQDRPRQPLLADGTKLALDAALDKAADLLRGRTIVGIGSPRASLESNYGLRELVGAEYFYSGMEAGELARVRLALNVLNNSPLPVPTLRDIEDHDAVFVLGEDLTQTAARVALAVRQATKGKAEAMADAMRVQPWLDAAVKNIGQHALYPLFIAAWLKPSWTTSPKSAYTPRRPTWPASVSPWPTPSTRAPRPSKAWTRSQGPGPAHRRRPGRRQAPTDRCRYLAGRPGADRSRRQHRQGPEAAREERLAEPGRA